MMISLMILFTAIFGFFWFLTHQIWIGIIAFILLFVSIITLMAKFGFLDEITFDFLDIALIVVSLFGDNDDN